MNFVGYKFEFTTAVHFGKQNLDDAGYGLYADTIFSAICQEALKMGGENLVEEIADAVKSGELRFTDAFPYHNDTLYLPKPRVLRQAEESVESAVKKADKKLEYLPFDEFEEYISGSADVVKVKESLNNLGKTEVRTMAAVCDNDNTRPFPVGGFWFSPGWGLYIVVGYEDRAMISQIEEVLMSVGITGIGGKKSAGMGKFSLNPCRLSESFVRRLSIDSEAKKLMTLSVSYPDINSEEELEELLEGATYTLLRRGGFIDSANYSTTMRKKKDVYFFKSGGIFLKTFRGSLIDLAGNGAHPVYRYAQPIFWEV